MVREDSVAALGGGLALLGLLLAYRGWRRSRTRWAALWALTLIALAFWGLGESLTVLSPAPETRLLWIQLRTLGIVGLAPLLLWSAVQYAGAVLQPRPRHLIAVFLIPALTFLLALTNPAHHGVWSTLEIDPQGRLQLAFGPWFWVHTFYALLTFLAALAFMLPTLVHGDRRILPGIGILTVGAALIMTGLAASLYDPSYTRLPAPWHGLPALTLGLATALLGVAFQSLLHAHPIPIARSLIVESLQEGILILDPKGRVVDVNPRMAEALGRPLPEILVGAPLDALLQPWPALQAFLRDRIRDRQEGATEVRHPTQDRWFRVSLQPIQRHGEPWGWVVRASEITDEKQRAMRRARQQETLLRLTKDPEVHSGNLEAAMQRVAWAAAEALQVSRVNIWRLDPAAGRLTCLVHVDWPEGTTAAGMTLRADDYPAYFAALRAGRAIDAADAENDPRTRELRETYLRPLSVRSLLDAPIRREGEVVGVICHEQKGAIRHWTEDEIAFAAEMADLIALIWAGAERRAEEERARHYAQQLQWLQELAQDLHRAAGPEALYQRALQGAIEVLGADRAAILVRDPDGVLRFKAWRNLSEGYREAVEGHWPWDPQDPHPQILWVADAAHTDVLGELQDVVLREGIRALAFIPIQDKGGPLGKLMLYYDRPRPADPETLRLAEILAGAVATALRRRRETWLWEAVASALQEVLSSPPAFRERVPVVLRVARRLFRADRAGLWFYEPVREQVACAGVEGLSETYVQQLLARYRQVPGVRAIEVPTVIHIPDAWNDPRTAAFRDQILREGFRSYVVFPLWASTFAPGEFPFRGVLTLYWDRPWTLGPEELLIGQAFANAAAQALASAHLFEETQRWARQEAALRQVVTTILHAENLDEILQVGLRQALEATGLRRGEIYLWEDLAKRLRLRAAVGPHPPAPERSPGEDPVGLAFQKGQALVFGDLPREASGSLRTPPPWHEARALIAIPLRSRTSPVGVLCLHDPEPRLFTEEERALIQHIADHLALAVERAALVERLADQVREVSLLYEASANLLASRETSTTLSLLGRFLCDITGGTYVRLYRYQEGSGALEGPVEFPSPEVASGEHARWVIRTRSAALRLRQEALRERKPITLRVSDPTAPFPEDREILEALGVRRLMVLPLVRGPHLLGLVEIWDHQEDRPFTLAQSALSMAIVNHAAVALENARLVERLDLERGRLRALIHAAMAGILLIGTDGTLVEINPAALDLLDPTGDPGKWIGVPWTKALWALKRRRPEMARRLVQHLRATDWDPTEARVLSMEAHGRILQVHLVPVRSDSEILGWLVMSHDLTPIRMAERLREELLHMIVHDLRNPIASIRTALDFVLVEGLGPLTSEQQEVLRIARDNTDRLLRMVNTILDLRRLEAGEMALQPKPLALAALVGEVLRGMQPLLQEKALRVHVELPEGLPPAWGDEEVLSRVLQNLLENAIKFTPSGGSIWVRADVEREDGRPWIQVTVADSGPGIPSGLRQQIFQPFVTGMVPNRGVGLGLAFCRLAVEAHGGKIWVEDHPSGGAAFVFTIPVAPDRSASS